MAVSLAATKATGQETAHVNEEAHTTTEDVAHHTDAKETMKDVDLVADLLKEDVNAIILQEENVSTHLTEDVNETILQSAAEETALTSIFIRLLSNLTTFSSRRRRSHSR